MKLYTRDEIKLMLENMGTHTEESVEYFLDELIPIELPNDEEIEKAAFQIPYDGSNEFYDKRFIKGVEWLIDKIKNQ